MKYGVEITGTEDILTWDQVRHRVWYIESWDCGEDADCGDDDCPRHGSTLEELTALRELQAEVSDGETLISESYLPRYVQSSREDEGGIPEDMAYYIDWEQYAEDQRAEYSSVTFRGTSYYYE